MSNARTILTCVMIAAMSGHAAAQENPGSWRIEAPAAVVPGEVATMQIVFDIQPGWQMYAPSPVNEAAGVTGLAIKVEPPKGLAVSQPDYPHPRLKGRYEVYENSPASVAIKLRPGKETENGTYTLTGNVQYQFCRPDLCLPPQREAFSVEVEVR